MESESISIIFEPAKEAFNRFASEDKGEATFYVGNDDSEVSVELNKVYSEKADDTCLFVSGEVWGMSKEDAISAVMQAMRAEFGTIDYTDVLS